MLAETHLSWIMRRIAGIRGVPLATRHLRRHCCQRYAHRTDRWVTIADYDRDIRITLDRSTYMGGSIYWTGYHHRAELTFLRRLFAPSMVFVDVGANQGEFTLFAAKYLRDGKVLSFEPQRDIFNVLRRNIAMNQFRNVVAFNCGLGSKEGCASLFTSHDTSRFGGWHEGLFTSFPCDYRNEYVQDIEVRELDAVLAKASITRVDVMKVDVEGAELYVLEGAKRTLKSKPTLIIEINESTFRRAGYTVSMLVDFLSTYSYRFFEFERGGDLREIDVKKFRPIDTSYNICCQ